MGKEDVADYQSLNFLSDSHAFDILNRRHSYGRRFRHCLGDDFKLILPFSTDIMMDTTF